MFCCTLFACRLHLVVLKLTGHPTLILEVGRVIARGWVLRLAREVLKEVGTSLRHLSRQRLVSEVPQQIDYLPKERAAGLGRAYHRL
jgi:hypothetical protein